MFRIAPQIDVTQDEIQCKSEHVRPVTLDGDDPILLLKLGRNQEIKMRMIARKVCILVCTAHACVHMHSKTTVLVL